MEKKKRYRLADLLYNLLWVLALFLLIQLFNWIIGGQAVVHGVSMEPQLEEGDRLVVRKLFYEPKRGDVVICRTGKGYENELVKRIIGIPGDEIDMDGETGTVYVNGEALEEPYCKDRTHVTGDITYPMTVPRGQYFVLGDNREVSIDSRYSEIGTIEAGKIDGQVLFCIYPFHRMGKIN